MLILRISKLVRFLGAIKEERFVYLLLFFGAVKFLCSGFLKNSENKKTKGKYQKASWINDHTEHVHIPLIV